MLKINKILPIEKNHSVLQIADFGAPYSGNFIALLQELSKYLGKSCFKQILVLPKRASKQPWFSELIKSNGPVYLINEDTSILNLSREIAKICVIENVSLIHTHFTKFDVPSYLARTLAILKGLKRKPSIIWHVHSNFPVKKNVVRRIKDRIKWSFMGRQVHVICDSDELEEIIISKRFTGRSSVVINGVDIQRVLKTTTSRQSLRESLNIPHNNLLMLSFGWSPYVKGVDILIKAAKELHRNDISILIIGKDLLNRYISKEFCKLPDNIVIAEPDECVGNLYNVADVFISASRYEGCPYSVMEAMATGLPVIASNIKAMKWARELPGITFFESENYDDLRQKILVISSMDLKRRNEISKLNSEFIKENYSTKSWVNNIINIYRGLYLNENSHFS